MFFQKKDRKIKKAGYTLIELLVAIGIFAIITGIILFNYSDFNSNVILSNLSYDVALQIREAQVFSLGVTANNNGSVDNFQTRFGVYVNTSESDTFMFFADADRNGECDGCSPGVCAPATDCRKVTTLNRQIVFSKICFSKTSINPIELTSGDCTASAVEAEKVFITFDRPNPNAKIKAFVGGIENNNNDYEGSVALVLKAPNENKRVILIRNTGEISNYYLPDNS